MVRAMPTRDKRVKKLPGDLGNDIIEFSPGGLFSWLSGEAKDQYVLRQTVEKLQALMKVYGISHQNVEVELFSLSVCLAEEFVKGFKVIPLSRWKPLRTKGKPQLISPEDWAALFRLIHERTTTGQSINQACKSIIAKHQRWSKYKHTSLAASYRRERAKVDHLLKSDELSVKKSGYTLASLAEMAQTSGATKVRTKTRTH